MTSLSDRLHRLERLRAGPCLGHETEIAVEYADRDDPPAPPRFCAGCGRPAEVVTIRLNRVPDRPRPGAPGGEHG